MCGEHSTTNKTISSIIGLSPHTRGTLSVTVIHIVVFRFIPAYALNTVIHSLPYSATWVYPCIRGEHRICCVQRSPIIGLSLHKRGTHAEKRRKVVLWRFIPAYAGNTISNMVFKLAVWFIPAYAGNTSVTPLSFQIRTVYPRIRGEHKKHNWLLRSDTGLSPHTRGTPLHIVTFTATDRFIPAYAGNTTLRQLTVKQETVYPRIRGEHRRIYGLHAARIGLSPHTRGTHPLAFSGFLTPRFIPAYAGNTSQLKNASTSTPVYPRIRGEHRYKRLCYENHVGLSPHTRGTLRVFF